MAGRFQNPYPQFSDSTPTMYSGAKLFFYAAGTSTKQNTYSDRTLSSANTNPVILNSAGRPAVEIWLQDLDYKVVLAPSTDTDPPANPIWSSDYVRARDSALVAKTLTGSGAPTGVAAGTAGSASILPDFYWDYTNAILYVCTTTGSVSTAVWTAVNASTAAAVVPPPQGYLTLTSATPMIVADVTAATAVYYTPFVGSIVPIYNGSAFAPTVFTELTLTLSASHALTTVYDVFVFSNSGVLTLVTGPAWTTSTVGSGARGSGAGTTQISRLSGLWVNTVQITGRNGATTYTVAANQATFLGSIYIDGTAGQVSCYTTWGANRKWGVSNAYNRMPVIIKSGYIGGTTNYTTNAWRVLGANTGSILTVFSCLPEERFDATFIQQTGAVTLTTGQSSALACGIGFNTAAIPTGPYVTNNVTNSNAAGHTLTLPGLVSKYQSIPLLGVQQFQPLENGLACTTNSILAGSEANSTISASWRA
jgi:hypothetical protein